MKKTLNVLVSTDRNYLKYLRVLMVSVYENHPEQKVDFYVLHDELNAEDEAYLNEVAQMYGQKVNMLKVDPSIYDEFPFSNRWTRACLYPLLAHQLLPENVERILYLDIDVAVDGNINDYYWMPFDDCYLIATKPRYYADQEVKIVDGVIPYEKLDDASFVADNARSGDYFNSGVLLLNIEKFRKMNVDIEFYKHVIMTVTGKRRIFYDQGIFNMAFVKESKLLSVPIYNFRTDFGLRSDFKSSKQMYEMKKVRFRMPQYASPIIYHYVNELKPWKARISDINTLYGELIGMFPEAASCFNTWWKYAEKVSDYSKLLADAKNFQPSLTTINKMLLMRHELTNLLKVSTLDVPVKFTIQANEDLNEYIIPGNYRCRSQKEKSTILNCPEQFTEMAGFRLTVKYVSSADTVYNNTSCIQILEPNLPDCPVYRRYYYGGKRTLWSPWCRMATDKDLEALKQTNAAQSEQITQLTEQLAAAQQELEAQKECIAQLETMKNEMEAQKKLIESLTKIVLS